MTAAPLLTNGELDAAIYLALPPVAIAGLLLARNPIPLPRAVNHKTTEGGGVLVVMHQAYPADEYSLGNVMAIAVQQAIPMRIFEPAPNVVLDLTRPPTPFDEPSGVLCDQPQPLVKLIHCWPRHLEAGDVLYTNLQRPNGLPYSRRYTLVSVEHVTARDVQAVIEWQDTHERETRRFFEGLVPALVVDGSKFTRARKDMRWVKAANGALGSYLWREDKGK